MRITKIIAVMIIFVGISVSAFATETRDKGLGLYDNPWFIDGLQTYIDLNPSYLGDFKDSAFLERSNVTGVTAGQNLAGIFYAPTEGLTFGIYYGKPVNTTVWNTTDREGLFDKGNYSVVARNKRNSALGTVLGAYQEEMLDSKGIIDLTDPVNGSALDGTQTSSPSLRKLLYQRDANLLMSYDFDGFSVGFSGGYATSWNNVRSGGGTDYDEYNLVNTEYSAGFGMRFKLGDKVGADVAGNWVMYQLENTYKKSQSGGHTTNMSYKSNGAMDFGGFARINYQMTEAHKSHFLVGYSMLNRSTAGKMLINNPTTPVDESAYDVDAKDTFSRKGQAIKVGISDEIAVNDSTKAYLGFSVEYTTFQNDYSGKDAIISTNSLNKYTSSWKAINIPLIVGLESKLSDNWTGRFGAVQTIYKPFSASGKTVSNAGTSSIPSSVNENSSSATTLNIGLSYKLGNFTLDWLANIDMFTQGPYFVSGKSYVNSTDNNPMAMSFAATYKFE